jgi:spore maturation protein CgeB
VKAVILGSSITCEWRNSHAVVYRELVRELVARGHEVLFLERDTPWNQAKRDLLRPPYGKTRLYGSFRELERGYGRDVREADLVMVGSNLIGGIAVGEWVMREARGVTAFYDLDTPVTLAKLEAGKCDYITPHQISRYDLYLTLTDGPALKRLEGQLGFSRSRLCLLRGRTAAHQAAELEHYLQELHGTVEAGADTRFEEAAGVADAVLVGAARA